MFNPNGALLVLSLKSTSPLKKFKTPKPKVISYITKCTRIA